MHKIIRILLIDNVDHLDAIASSNITPPLKDNELHQFLNKHFFVETVKNFDEAVSKIIKNFKFDFIFAKINTNLSLWEKIKAHPVLSKISVILLISEKDSPLFLEAFEAGCEECLELPIKKEIARARIEKAYRLNILKNDTRSMILDLKEKSEKDPLTHLFNRQGFKESVVREIAKSQREKEFVSLLVIDLDHFKNLNDTYGHLVGDEVLVFFSKFLMKQLRVYDIISRYGGDEFVVLLPNTALPEAILVAEKLQAAFNCESFSLEGGSTSVSCSFSIGVAALSSAIASISIEEDLFQQLFLEADQVLYRAKKMGRNCLASSNSVIGSLSKATALMNKDKFRDKNLNAATTKD